MALGAEPDLMPRRTGLPHRLAGLPYPSLTPSDLLKAQYEKNMTIQELLRKILRKFCVRCCPLSVELNGDSILFGWGCDSTPAMQMRAQRPRWTLTDRNACGLRMADFMQGYQEPFPGAPPDMYPAGPQPAFKDALHQAQVIVLGLGLNDSYGYLSPEAYRQQLLDALAVIRSAGAVPVFTGLVPIPSGYYDPGQDANLLAFQQVMRDVAESQGVIHADWDEEYQGEGDLQEDHIHRSQNATDRLTARLIAAIDRAATRV